jgi:hypothetical protein
VEISILEYASEDYGKVQGFSILNSVHCILKKSVPYLKYPTDAQ